MGYAPATTVLQALGSFCFRVRDWLFVTAQRRGPLCGSCRRCALMFSSIAGVHADAIEGASTPLRGVRLCCGSSLLMSALNLVFSRLFRIICGPAAVDGRRPRHAAPSFVSVALLQERNPAASVPKGFK